jgi:hypothetical protein
VELQALMPYSALRNRHYPSFRDTPSLFWAKVAQGAPDVCWPWLGARSTNGYGRAGRRDYAHRLAYELTNGPAPAGLDVMHACDNRVCCNPAHLSVGTRAENMRGCVERGRHFSPWRKGDAA